MLSARTLVAALALAVAIVMVPASAFAPANGNGRPTTSLAVMGPKQAAAMERLKNPAKFESTIQVCVCIGLPRYVYVYIEYAFLKVWSFLMSHLSFLSLFRPLQGLMAQKGLTRGQAEKRYGEFLADPDGFALKAAEEQRREKGEWN